MFKQIPARGWQAWIILLNILDVHLNREKVLGLP